MSNFVKIRRKKRSGKVCNWMGRVKTKKCPVIPGHINKTNYWLRGNSSKKEAKSSLDYNESGGRRAV